MFLAQESRGEKFLFNHIREKLNEHLDLKHLRCRQVFDKLRRLCREKQRKKQNVLECKSNIPVVTSNEKAIHYINMDKLEESDDSTDDFIKQQCYRHTQLSVKKSLISKIFILFQEFLNI